MNYKKNRQIIGSIKNRDIYIARKPYCEICGATFPIAIHHHIDQQKIQIEYPCNYTVLCHTHNGNANNCHGKLDKKSQFIREARINPQSDFNGMSNSELYDYLKKLKVDEYGYKEANKWLV